MAVKDQADAKKTVRSSMKNRAHAQLEATLACMAEGLYRLDKKSRLVYMNSACERILGYEFADVRGLNFHEFVQPNRRSGDERFCPLTNVVQSGETFHTDEAIFITKAGTRLQCTVTSTPLVINGEMDGAVICFHDNGPAREAEQNLRLLELMQQREAFMSTLAHDLKTPILASDRVLALILDSNFGDLPPLISELLLKIKTSNQAMLQMVQNLLAVYRYESGVEEMTTEPVELQSLIHECSEEIRVLAEGRKLRVSLDIEPDAEVYGDRLALRRVLSNLLSNAVKFTPGPGDIAVTVRNRQRLTEISVRDSGIGIQPEEMEKLFERFHLGQGGKRNRAIGTGLGLHLCKQIVKAHGGDIMCQSKPGEGTTFRVTLPRDCFSERRDHQVSQPSAVPGRG